MNFNDITEFTKTCQDIYLNFYFIDILFLHRDIAVMDQDGYCSIVGRITDMIIRGGENVYAFEIEQIIYHHPDVKDVQVFMTMQNYDIFWQIKMWSMLLGDADPDQTLVLYF